MTISTTGVAVTAEGNNATSVWPYTFEIPGGSATDQTYVIVTVVDRTVDPPITTIIADADYTITGVRTDAGGTVTYPLSGTLLAPNQFITIYRDTPLLQQTQITNQRGLLASAFEAALDYQMMCVQSIQWTLGNCLRLDPTDPDAPMGLLPLKSTLTNTFLAFDASGNPFGSTATIPSAPVSAFMVTLLAATSSVAVNVVLGTIPYSTYIAKGDILVGTGTAAASILSIGAAGAFLRADTAASTGVSWQVSADSGNTTIPGFLNLQGSNNVSTPSTIINFSFIGATLKGSSGLMLSTNTASSFQVNVGTAGPAALGRDQAAAFSASSWIYFHAIASANTVSMIASLASSTPTFPTGYSYSALAAALYLGTASTFYNVYLRNDWHWYQAVLADFYIVNSTTVTAAEITASLSTSIPPIALEWDATWNIVTLATGGGHVTTAMINRIVSAINFDIISITAQLGNTDSTASRMRFPYVSSSFYYALSNITFVSTISQNLEAKGYRIANGAR